MGRYIFQIKNRMSFEVVIDVLHEIAQNNYPRLQGVPSPFQVELIVESNTPERLEKKIHEELREYRHSKEVF